MGFILSLLIFLEKCNINFYDFMWLEGQVGKSPYNFIPSVNIVVHHILYFSSIEITELIFLRNEHQPYRTIVSRIGWLLYKDKPPYCGAVSYNCSRPIQARQWI